MSLGALHAAATAVEALTAAWQELLADDRTDGMVSPGTARVSSLTEFPGSGLT
ncbi:hypothetical protein ACFQ1L_35875 [Phytohabitans flavus]|uniref:hypothetical protein n=1 Tax=Phytohabitans flavus TaxID=1076124 RepID=UPI00362AE0E0